MKKSFNDMSRRRQPDHELEFHVNNIYLDDYLRILQSKAYRRLNFKTQVYTTPRNPHVRTRAVHTNEVISISIFLASRLGLDINLVQAIAAGHDIGHTPFGHLGEKVLSELSGQKFRHAVFSVIVAQKIERQGKGLNLSKGTLLGILNHARGKYGLVTRQDLPPEFDVVMFADKIAYTFSDLNDAKRYSELAVSKYPKIIEELGENQRARVYKVVTALIKESREVGRVSFSKGEIFQKFENLRQWMYKNIYEKVNRPLQVESLKAVYDYFQEVPQLVNFNSALLIALMTDMEVIDLAHELMRSYKPVWQELRNFGFIELLPYLKEVSLFEADLDW